MNANLETDPLIIEARALAGAEVHDVNNLICKYIWAPQLLLDEKDPIKRRQYEQAGQLLKEFVHRKRRERDAHLAALAVKLGCLAIDRELVITRHVPHLPEPAPEEADQKLDMILSVLGKCSKWVSE